MENKSFKRYGRSSPYTQIGIGRLPCARCGKPATQQWQICSDNRLFRPICDECDIALNELVLKFMNDPDAKEKMEKYREKMLCDKR